MSVDALAPHAVVPRDVRTAFNAFRAFFSSIDSSHDESIELAHSLVIICPDDGKQLAYHNRCPKCGGASWIPAGHLGNTRLINVLDPSARPH